MKHLHIAVGIIRDEQRRIFLTQRSADSHMANKWEFAGGKLEPGETAEQALKRELNEEVGIDAISFLPFMNIEHQFDDRYVTINFFIVEKWLGEPYGREGQPQRWVAQSELRAEEFPPANADVIARLIASA
ncbi:8-oxo-dGTP diphosphatase MutT [Erwinia sp. SLM-02]|uniref:8-oxo-dGTP diphosphatase MutT n=1 Tax=Erwinia sp. SLM-02 TaxID=3020057 RepID=UPI0028D5F19E|nr:8-oxo-dGTP diphosphatase MutT [uncultured Erwinia sp.]